MKTSTKFVFAAAMGLASLTLADSASALPMSGLNPALVAADKTADGAVQDVRWVCRPWGCHWAPNFWGPRWGYYHPWHRHYGWGWHRRYYW